MAFYPHSGDIQIYANYGISDFSSLKNFEFLNLPHVGCGMVPPFLGSVMEECLALLDMYSVTVAEDDLFCMT